MGAVHRLENPGKIMLEQGAERQPPRQGRHYPD
jgi:hypothetical protein